MEHIYKKEGPCICGLGKVVQIIISEGFLPPRVAIPSLMCSQCSSIWHIDHAVDTTGDELRLHPTKYAFVPNSIKYQSHPKLPVKSSVSNDEVLYLVEHFSKSVLLDAREEMNSITNCANAEGSAKRIIYGLKKYFHSAKRNSVVEYLNRAIDLYSHYSGDTWDARLERYEDECREYRKYLRIKSEAEKPIVVLGDEELLL